jgi:hypothetical protein
MNQEQEVTGPQPGMRTPRTGVPPNNSLHATPLSSPKRGECSCVRASLLVVVFTAGGAPELKRWAEDFNTRSIDIPIPALAWHEYNQVTRLLPYTCMHDGVSGVSAPVKGNLMPAILRDPPEPVLLAAIDRNWRASMRAFGLAPHVQLRDDNQVFWFITGVPDPAFNSIMYAHLTHDQIATVVGAFTLSRAAGGAFLRALNGPTSPSRASGAVK